MKRLGDTRDQTGESPLWSVEEQALYWVDIEGRWVRRLDWATQAVRSWQLAERVGCIALRAAGGLVAAMESGVFALHLPDDRDAADATLLHAIRFPRDSMRFNDGRCDRQGRLWVTSMVRDMSHASAAGCLYRVDADGISAPLVDGLVTGNGLAFTSDGRQMYLSDSHPTVQRIWRFDVSEAGALANRREFVDMNPLPGRPDGAAIDSDGGYWICANDAGCVHLFTPDGRLDRSIAVPVAKPSMCAFGGPDMSHLFIASIHPATPIAGYDAELAGGMFVTQPGAHGLAEVPFRS